jgi:hypothetical protein
MAPPRPSPSLSSTLSPPDVSTFFLGDLAPVLHIITPTVVSTTQHAARHSRHMARHDTHGCGGGGGARDLVELKLFGEGARGGHAPTAPDALAAAPGDLAAGVEDPQHVGRQECEQCDPENRAVQDPPARRLCSPPHTHTHTHHRTRTHEVELSVNRKKGARGMVPHFQTVAPLVTLFWWPAKVQAAPPALTSPACK